MTADLHRPTASFAIRRLRFLILLALLVGVTAITATLLDQIEGLSDRFGPQVRADLEWRAMRGAAEIARTADLGLAVGDAAMVHEAFGALTTSADVLGVVAVDASGQIIARHGMVPPLPTLFAGVRGGVARGPGFLSSWTPVEIEGATIGRVAVVVSTARLSGTRAILDKVSSITLIAGIAVLLLGAIVVCYFARAVATRDLQLREHAATLERRVHERTHALDEANRGMRLVLDNTSRGFITIDLRGEMSPQRSAIVDRWFGPPPASKRFADLVAPAAPDFAAWFDLGLDMLREGAMPPAVCIDQLPARMTDGARTFEVAYQPILVGTAVERLLVILHDVTTRLALERAELEQRELAVVFQRLLTDRAGCVELIAEGDALAASLATPGDRTSEDRALHTLRGTCGLFGFERFSRLCQDLEGELADSGADALDAAQRERLATGWAHVVATLRSLLGEPSRDVVEVPRGDLDHAIELAQRRGSDELAAQLAGWTAEPVARRFERLGQQASGLAARLGKGPLHVEIADAGVRLEPARWAPLWTALVHVIRNAVDHGLETAAERARLGKGEPRLRLTASQTAHRVVLSIADDGRGIDWEAVRASARAAGLRCETAGDLERALFADGLTSLDEPSELSGRGIGLAAVRDAVTARGGSISVTSTPGTGTRFDLAFPAELTHPGPAGAVPTQGQELQ